MICVSGAPMNASTNFVPNFTMWERKTP